MVTKILGSTLVSSSGQTYISGGASIILQDSMSQADGAVDISSMTSVLLGGVIASGAGAVRDQLPGRRTAIIIG
jgi:hypothetical protein